MKHIHNKFFEENPNEHSNLDEHKALLFLENEKLLQNFINSYGEEFKQITGEHDAETAVRKRLNEVGEILLERYPVFSNDTLVDDIICTFIENADQETKSKLKQIYFGKKLTTDDANAIAHNSDPNYDGLLITSNLRFDTVLMLLSDIFAALCTLRVHIDDDLSLSRLLVMKLRALVDLNEISIGLETQLPNKKHRDYFQFVYWKTFGSAQTFVVGHEVAHHLLNHTSGSEPWKFSGFPSQNIYHDSEFSADDLALDLMFNVGIDYKEIDIDFDCLMGPIINMILISMQAIDPTEPSEQHPAPLDRLKRILDYSKETFSTMQYDLIRSNTRELLELINAINHFWDKRWWDDLDLIVYKKRKSKENLKLDSN
ncbi:hypothetical protein MHI48_20985 [Paenibacillus sp. FSL H7-0942]|uniref:hypothetical protein n=1 Tax=Paenibacillus TaxID=44249 RepID=UPI00096C00DD|nr:hypothetical protein [Paenibacillus amylolyticus]OMF06413.1 hypothetical protein BK129_12135 [Paenibacillus amylolyticus]